MSRALILSRRLALLAFAAGMGLTFWSLYAESMSYGAFVLLAGVAICIFIGTEAFGPIAQQRRLPIKIFARVMFVLAVITTISTAMQLYALHQAIS